MPHIVKTQQGQKEKERLGIRSGEEESRGKHGEIEHRAVRTLGIEIFLDQAIEHGEHAQTGDIGDNEACEERVMCEDHQTSLQQGV